MCQRNRSQGGKNSVRACGHVSEHSWACVFYCDGYGMHHQWWHQTGLTWWWIIVTSHKDTGLETHANIRKVRNGQMPVSMERCTQSGCWQEHPTTGPGGRQSPECPLDPHSVTVSDFLQWWRLNLGPHGYKTKALLLSCILIPHCRILI